MSGSARMLRWESWLSGITERAIRDRVAQGGAIRAVFIVSASTALSATHAAYVLTSWAVGYRELRTHNERSTRAYRDLRRLLGLLREDFGFRRCIPIYLAGDPELARFPVFAPRGPDAPPKGEDGEGI